MIERKRETDCAVVFQTKEGRIVWTPLGDSTGAEEMIKERENQGDRVLIITSSSEAKKRVEEQTGYKADYREKNFFKR